MCFEWFNLKLIISASFSLLWYRKVLFSLISEFTCPEDCSGAGNCDVSVGECSCNVGRHGSDCSSKLPHFCLLRKLPQPILFSRVWLSCWWNMLRSRNLRWFNRNLCLQSRIWRSNLWRCVIRFGYVEIYMIPTVIYSAYENWKSSVNIDSMGIDCKCLSHLGLEALCRDGRCACVERLCDVVFVSIEYLFSYQFFSGISCPGGETPCSNNGLCNLLIGFCSCDEGFQGDDCSGNLG